MFVELFLYPKAFGEPEEDGFEDDYEWLSEVSEDLDVYIAQRHFEEAHTLIEKTRECLDKAPSLPANIEIRYVRMKHYSIYVCLRKSGSTFQQSSLL